MTSLLHVRPMVENDLEMVLNWRNHPEVRRYMYTQQEIALKNHIQWFERESKNEKRHLLIFEYEEIPRGFANICHIAPGNLADWGFYTDPAAPKGMGTLLGQAVLAFGFDQLRLHKICGQVLIYNQRSLAFHEKLGFTREGTLRDQHFDGYSYHDVVCYGLKASEWQSP